MSGIEPIKVPKWGLSMEEGSIVEWHIAEGDHVKEGDDLVDIETTKITNVCEAHMDGHVRRIVAAPGQTLPVGALIAVLADESVPESEIELFISEYEENFDPEEVAAEEQSLEIKSINLADQRTLRVGIAGADKSAMPFVLLHGFGGDLENWSLVMEQLSKAHVVYAIELPGHGHSSKDVGEGNLEDLASAIVSALDALGLQEVILVGHSLGGAVAASIASNAPDRVTALGLVAPAAMSGGNLSESYLDSFVDARRARDLKPTAEMLFHEKSLVNREMLDELIKLKRLDGAKEALFAIKEGLKGRDPAYAQLGENLKTYTGNLVVIASASDQIVGIPDASLLPDQTNFVHLKNSGHMPHIENLGAVIDALNTLV